MSLNFVKVVSPSNKVFGGKPSHTAWKVSDNTAKSYCETQETCSGFCNHPADHTFFYEGTLVEADMYERGALGQYPPGWTCYVAERREVSPDSNYVESLLRAPRL